MLNFPNAPVDGELSTQDNGVTYQWQAAKTRWVTPIALGQALVAGTVVQEVEVFDGIRTEPPAVAIPLDDTIPQISEGSELFSLAITPKFANSVLQIDVVCNLSSGATGALQVAMFRDSIADSIGAVTVDNQTNVMNTATFSAFVNANSVSNTVFSIRAGTDGAASVRFNGIGSGQFFGGVMASSITITEIAQ
jgi:hypothetical protein